MSLVRSLNDDAIERTGNYIVFLAYGKECAKQCLYALISFYSIHGKESGVKFAIYTDQLHLFEVLRGNLNYELIKTDEEMINHWKNGYTLFRGKIKMGLDFMKKLEGNALFLDTDIVFIKNVIPLFNKINVSTSVLHTQEGKLATGKWPEFLKLIGKTFNLKSGDTFYIENGNIMWNAGAIGINSANKSLLNDVLDFHDQMCGVYLMGLNEQFSYSCVLQKRTKIISGKRFIFHYWPRDFKRAMSQYIDEKIISFPNASLYELMPVIHNNDILRISLFQKLVYNLHPEVFFKKAKDYFKLKFIGRIRYQILSRKA